MIEISEEPLWLDPDNWHIVTDQGIDALINF